MSKDLFRDLRRVFFRDFSHAGCIAWDVYGDLWISMGCRFLFCERVAKSPRDSKGISRKRSPWKIWSFTKRPPAAKCWKFWGAKYGNFRRLIAQWIWGITPLDEDPTSAKHPVCTQEWNLTSEYAQPTRADPFEIDWRRRHLANLPSSQPGWESLGLQADEWPSGPVVPSHMSPACHFSKILILQKWSRNVSHLDPLIDCTSGWFCWENLNRKPWVFSVFSIKYDGLKPVKIFLSSNSMKIALLMVLPWRNGAWGLRFSANFLAVFCHWKIPLSKAV